MSDKKNNIHLWKKGINPETGRSIKIWGQKWMQILDKYGWYDHIPQLDSVNMSDVSQNYLNFIKTPNIINTHY